MAFGETSDIGRRTGMYMTIMSFGALAGPPISGAINTSTGGYKDVGIYAGMSKCRVAYIMAVTYFLPPAGSVVMVAVVIMLCTRYIVLKSLWGRI